MAQNQAGSGSRAACRGPAEGWRWCCRAPCAAKCLFHPGNMPVDARSNTCLQSAVLRRSYMISTSNQPVIISMARGWLHPRPRCDTCRTDGTCAIRSLLRSPPPAPPPRCALLFRSAPAFLWVVSTGPPAEARQHPVHVGAEATNQTLHYDEVVQMAFAAIACDCKESHC